MITLRSSYVHVRLLGAGDGGMSQRLLGSGLRYWRRASLYQVRCKEPPGYQPSFHTAYSVSLLSYRTSFGARYRNLADVTDASREPRRLESIHDYHRVSEGTLEDLYESLTDLGGSIEGEYDVELSQGVLTISAGSNGTYVINTQTPNRQIWMSSPISGPWRYDWDPKKNAWVSTRDGHKIRNRLKEEFSTFCSGEVAISEEEPEL